jgi:tRNA threonylcarbamoyl adenosine modification protein YeaZ
MILGFDTSGPHVAAALRDASGRLCALRVEEMARGQAERLMPLIEALLQEAGAAWSDLTRIGVGIGPGNFTGIRIAVSAARGLALGLEIPAIGVSGFEVIRHHAGAAGLALIPGPRDQAYLQGSDGTVSFGPRPEAAHAALPQDWRANIATLTEIAAGKPPGARPAPLYVKPADAAPASDPPPVILDADGA